MGAGMLEGSQQCSNNQKGTHVTTNQPTYRSYLLRLWQTTNKRMVRASLLNVHDPSEQHHFVTIDDLYLFLCATGSALADEHDLCNQERGNKRA